jgi:hypothetical protein
VLRPNRRIWSFHHHGSTGVITELAGVRQQPARARWRRHPQLKLVCIDLQPNTTTHNPMLNRFCQMGQRQNLE